MGITFLPRLQSQFANGYVHNASILYHYFFLPFIFLLFVYSANKPTQHLHRLRNADFPAAPKTQGTEVLAKLLSGICPSNCEKSGSAIGDRAFLGWEMGLLQKRQDPSSDPSTQVSTWFRGICLPV